MADVCGVSATTVRTIWRQHRLQPHRSRTSKSNQDPQLAAKVTDAPLVINRTEVAAGRAGVA